MHIHYGAQMVLSCPVQSLREQLPCFRQFFALFVPELFLVYGKTHEVEAQFLKTGKILFLDVLTACFSTFSTLREPVADICTAFDGKIVCRLLCGASLCYGVRRSARHSPKCESKNHYLFHTILFRLINLLYSLHIFHGPIAGLPAEFDSVLMLSSTTTEESSQCS